MTASKPQNPPGGHPQRIFVNAETVVERPPTLFRVPAVKKPAPASPPASSPFVPSPHVPNPAVAPLQESPQTLAAPPAPLAAPPAPLAAPPRSPVDSVPHENSYAENPHLQIPRSEVPPPKGLDKDRFAKSRSAVSNAPVPVPVSRGWMEGMGSRLALLLLIGAVATVALLANRGSQQVDPNTTLANLHLPALEESADGDDAETDRAAADASQQAAAEEIATGANDTPHEPDTFADRAGDNLFSANSGSAATAPVASPTSDADADDSSTAATAPRATAPRAAVPAFDLAGLQSGIAPADAPPADAPRQFISEADRSSQDSTSHSSASITPEEAIRAAVDAAVAGIGPPSGGAGYATTDQPAGVSDWSQYLPPFESIAPAPYNAAPYNANSPYDAQYDGSSPAEEAAPFDPGSRERSVPSINPPRNQSGEPSYATGAEAPIARTAQNPYGGDPYSANSVSGAAKSNPWEGYGAAPASAAPQPGANPYPGTQYPANPYPATQYPATQYPATQYPATR